MNQLEYTSRDYDTNVAALVVPGTYYYRYAASNTAGFVWAGPPAQSLLATRPTAYYAAQNGQTPAGD